MNDPIADAAHRQIRSLLEEALERLGRATDEFHDPGNAILVAENLISQAAAAATGYRAIILSPAAFR